MATVSVMVWPSLTALFGPQTHSGPRTHRSRALDVEVAEGATLLDLLRLLAAAHPAFGAVMFGADDEPTDQVSVVVNDRLPELLDGLATRLSDGDRVILVQAYAGG